MISLDGGAALLYFIFAAGLAALLVAGIVENRRHQANLDRIPQRVLVNGSRGKSSITRLCAGALRGGGLRVVAKTTGSAARFIDPDGHEVPIYRKFGLANVSEQIGVLRQAADLGPDVLVMECMAVAPALQAYNQERLIRSTIGVISNVREDHLEEMGPTLERVARALAGTMPVGGTCVTAEREMLPVLEEEAARRDCDLVVADPLSVTDEELNGFEDFTLKENIAVALEVARLLGVGRAEALTGMRTAPLDPGAVRVEEYHAGGSTVRVANLFAANDPASTLINFIALADSGAIRPPFFVLINCRSDRVERNRQMGALVPVLGAERVFVIGHATRSAIAAIPADWAGDVVDLGGTDRDADEIFRTIVAAVDGDASLVAIGNLHGHGDALLEYLEEIGGARWS